MKVHFATAVVFAAGMFAVIGISKLIQCRYSRGAEGLAASARLDARRAQEQSRVYVQAADHCEPSIALENQNSVSHITKPSRIPTRPLSDLRLCVEHGILCLRHHRDKLEQLGLTPFLSDTPLVNGALHRES